MSASKGRSIQRWGGPSEVTSELGLKHESEVAMGSAGTSVSKVPGWGSLGWWSKRREACVASAESGQDPWTVQGPAVHSEGFGFLS